ncbi:hypothetical protein V3C99_004447 [Haemonchus contortus]|uniref:Uncharacterized protein n=1 Tax=Haemonchus contortus TaxID=6289 RepID=A0A7I4XXD9_HAECO
MEQQEKTLQHMLEQQSYTSDSILRALEKMEKYISGVTVVADSAAPCRVAKLKVNHADVFKTGLGRCTKTKATLRLKPDAHPVFKKKRPVPYAYVAALDEEIDRLLAEQVLSVVDYSAWAAPIVVVKKSNGALRLCRLFYWIERRAHATSTPAANSGRRFCEAEWWHNIHANRLRRCLSPN